MYEPKVLTRRSLSNSTKLLQDQLSTARGRLTQRDPDSRVPRYFGQQIHDITPTVEYLECFSNSAPKENLPYQIKEVEETKASENIIKSFSRILPPTNLEMDNSDACSLLSNEHILFDKESPLSQETSYNKSHSRIQSELPSSQSNSLLNISKPLKRSFALPLQAIHNVSYLKEDPEIVHVPVINKSSFDLPVRKAHISKKNLDLRQNKPKFINESVLKENVPVSTSARVSESYSRESQSFRGGLNISSNNPRTLEKKLWVEYFKKSFQKHYNQALSHQDANDSPQIKSNNESFDHIKNMAIKLQKINAVFLNLSKLSQRM